MMGRPTKLTPETQKRICDAIRLGMTRERSAEYAGIGLTTFHDWMSRGNSEDDGIYSDFSAAVKKAESEGIAINLKNIHTAAQDGNWQASAWILERRHPDEYGKNVTIRDDTARLLNDAIKKIEVADD